MKKKALFILLVLTAGGVLSLSACSKTNESESTTTPASTTKATEKETESTTVNPEDGNKMYPVPAGYRLKKPDVTYGTIETVQYDSTTVGKKRNVSVLLPANYSKDKKYPVLYLCHGLGQDNTQWTAEGGIHVTLGNMIAEQTAKEMIVVMPNCRVRENDSANPPDAFALTNYIAFDNFINDFQKDLKPFIEANYSVATGRENTAIGGFSMGGRVALHLGFELQDTFGYIGAFCPAPGIFGYTMMGVTEEGLFTKDEFKIIDAYKDDTYVMIVAGKTDRVVNNHPETYHKALDENNVPHTWFKVTGGHDFSVVSHGFYNFAQHLF